jgi:adenylate cyclase
VSESRKLAAILAADVVGYSRLTGADEDRTLARLRALRSDLIDPTISVHNGRVVKRTGDGALVEFRSVVDAVRCAIEIQNSMVERNAGLPADRRIEFRIGVHLGDVVEESDGDLMGDGVNIAARLEGIAAAGAICLSEDAYRQVKARLNLQVTDLGATRLKNIAEPIRVYSLEVGGADVANFPTRGSPASLEKSLARPAFPIKPSIAVLALQNMSGDAEQEYFSDGISEDVITDLSKLSELHVIARNSSFVYKHKAVSVPDVARDLGVRYVLEGSVRKAGNRVRVTAQLIDSTTGGHTWAERFDRDLTDIFAVQDELTREIVSALAIKLRDADRKRLGGEQTCSPEAYDCFLRGRELWYRQTKDSNALALEMLSRAVELDPNFAPAHAFLAIAHVRDYLNQWSASPSLSLERGLQSAQRAANANGDDPHALWALGSAYLWLRRYDEAERELEKAISLNANFSWAHVILGLVRHYARKSEQSLECFERAISLDPYADIYLHFQAQAYFQLGDYEKTIEILKRRITRNPDTDISRALLAASYGQLGRIREARLEWRELLRINPRYSLEHRRRVLPYKDPQDFERFVEGLRKAGLPNGEEVRTEAAADNSSPPDNQNVS